MSNMTKIEKAIDEYGYAVSIAMTNVYPKVSADIEAALFNNVQSRREYLLVLINVDALNQHITELQARIDELEKLLAVKKLKRNAIKKINPYDLSNRGIVKEVKHE